MKSFHVCAGIGLHALGFQRAGVTVAGLNEIDPYCQAVLAKNFPQAWMHDDLRKLTAKSIRDNCGRIDILEAGLPCQPSSVAGKRKGESDSRWLWGEFIRLALDIEARWVVTENVRGLLSLPESEGHFAAMEDAGYEVQSFIIGAWAVGAKHERQRVWTVAHASGKRFSRRVENERIPVAAAQASAEFGDTVFGEWGSLDAASSALSPVDGMSVAMVRRRIAPIGNANVWQIPFAIAKGILEQEQA